MNVDLLKKFVELTRKRRAAETGLEEILEQLKPLEELVIAEVAASGVQNIKVEVAGRAATVYVSTVMYARMRPDVKREDVVAALKRIPETRSLVNEGYNANSLSAYVRERLGERRLPLPPSLDKLVEPSERVAAHVNEGGAEQSVSARARRTVTSNNSKPHEGT